MGELGFWGEKGHAGIWGKLKVRDLTCPSKAGAKIATAIAVK